MSKSDFEKLSAAVQAQMSDRPLMDELGPEQIIKMILEEASELQEELEQAFVTDEVYPIVGEIGDIFYLVCRLGFLLGINLLDALAFKLARNEEKYDTKTLREKGVRGVREEWAENGGDKSFTHKYLYE